MRPVAVATWAAVATLGSGRRAILVFCVGAVAWPLVAGPTKDSYPLSSYPMFARSRPAVAGFDTAVALDDNGVELRLDPWRIGGTPEPVHAAVVVGRARVSGQAALLCAEIAARVARLGPARARTIEILRLEVDLLGWYREDAVVSQRRVQARCPVAAAS